MNSAVQRDASSQHSQSRQQMHTLAPQDSSRHPCLDENQKATVSKAVRQMQGSQLLQQLSRTICNVCCLLILQTRWLKNAQLTFTASHAQNRFSPLSFREQVAMQQPWDLREFPGLDLEHWQCRSPLIYFSSIVFNDRASAVGGEAAASSAVSRDAWPAKRPCASMDSCCSA